MGLTLDGRVTSMPTRRLNGAMADLSPLPEVGSTFEMPRRLETFGGFMTSGPVVIVAAYRDAFGDVLVNLSRNGRVFSTGVAWPMAESIETAKPEFIELKLQKGETNSPKGETNAPKTTENGRFCDNSGQITNSNDAQASDLPSNGKGDGDKENARSTTKAFREDPSLARRDGFCSNNIPDLQASGGEVGRTTTVQLSASETNAKAESDASGEMNGEGDDYPAATDTSSSPPSLGSGFAQYGNVVVIDFLNLLVRAFHAGVPSKIHAVKSLLQTCANVIERLQPEYLLFAADSGHDQRSEMYPAYKAHRPEKPQELRDQMVLGQRAIEAIGWPMIQVAGWEADDVIASLATSIAHKSSGFVVCSCDKDLFQLVPLVNIYHPWDQGKMVGSKHVEEKYGVKASQFGDYLALVGDTSDSVPGVRGIGPKKAAELLGQYGDLETVLDEARLQRIIGATGKALNAQADMARLSKKLVTLHCGLQLPFTWHGNEARSPNAGWVEALQGMDLGMAARRLMEVLPGTGRVRSGSSRIEVTCEQPKQFFGTIADRVSDVVEGDDQSLRRENDQASGVPADDTSPSGQTLREPAGDLGAERSAASDQPEGCTDPDWVRGFPVLARIEPGDEEGARRSVYASACRERDVILAEGKTNPWKRGTGLHDAWQRAVDRKPFELVGLPTYFGGTTPAGQPESNKQTAKSLF